MKNITLLFMSLIVFVLTRKGQSVQNDQYVSPAEIREWISYLASDEMKGRANGSEEMKTAANWIMEKFRENDVQPIFVNGEYFQNYSVNVRQRTINERNVIGILPGTDPVLKNQFIVLSAHFDHIGVRRGVKGDSICNGADDNAAGVCALIGIARKIKESGLKPGRTLIFAAFSGEEAGMRGSRYFVSNSPVSLKNVSADINFEMIGHSEYLGKNRYYMTGCSLSNLDNIIAENNSQTKFILVDTISIASSLFYGSDNLAFSAISRADGITTGVPSGTFATSTLAPYLHTPQDEASLFDFENMAGLINHFADMVLYLSDYKGEIKWTDPAFKRPDQ
jgi:hypothetical protein